MKKILLIISLLVIIVLSVSLYYKKSNTTTKKETKKVETLEKKVEKQLKSMSIEQKISQMLVLYYTKDTVDDNLKEILKKRTPGGFIITEDNITTYDKTIKFIKDLKENSEIPLIISMDQEGGNVQRLQGITDEDVLNVPYMYYVGKTNDENTAYKVGEILAHEMKTVGVNVAYAPVVDIYSNKDNTVIGRRSFGENKELVAKMGINVAKGLEDNGIIPTYKHFPGHGDTTVDSHFNLPVLNKTIDDLNNEELYPFKEAIRNNAKLIMIGHLAIPSIDGNTPATMSKKIIDILKKDLNYSGLIITDALNMGALTNNYTYEEMYTKTVEAGADILLMPNGSKEAIDIIKKNISEERIDESVKKILTFKYKYLKEYKLLDKSYLNNEEDKQIIENISKE